MPIEFSQAAPSINNVAVLQTPTTNAEQSAVQTDPQISPTAAQEAAQSTGQQAQADVVSAANGSALSADNNVTEEQVADAIDSIQSFVDSNQRNLSFSVDEDSQRSVVSVTDASSGDVIRQIPSEEVLELAQRLQELQVDFGSASGIFFNREV
jgi:flagellar protein FlaG